MPKHAACPFGAHNAINAINAHNANNALQKSVDG